MRDGMDQATVVYVVNGTTKTKHLSGKHLGVQMLDHCTLIKADEEQEAHFFRIADYVHLRLGRGLE